MKKDKVFYQIPGINMSAAFLLFILIAVSCGQQGQVVAVIEEATDQEHCMVPYDSIGVEVGDAMFMFGSIWGSDYTPDGNIAILDRAIGGIRFFTEDGTYIETFSPTGEGPGEFMTLDRMGFDQEGNLYLGSFNDRKLCLYDRDFNLLKEILLTSSERTGTFKMYPDSDSAFVGMTWYLSEDSIGTEVARYSTSETPDLIYRRRLIPTTDSGNYQQLTGMITSVDPDGKVFIADNLYEQFKIICYSPTGDSLFAFGFDDYEPIPIPESTRDESRQRVLERYVAQQGSAEGFDFEPAEFYMPIRSISVDSQNRLWIREEYNSSIAYIFDDEGTYLYTMETDFPDWQNTQGWNLRISPRGILADPRNPDEYPLVYMMKERSVSSPE